MWVGGIKLVILYYCRFSRRECFVGFQEDTPAAVVYLASKQREKQAETEMDWEDEVGVMAVVHTCTGGNIHPHMYG